MVARLRADGITGLFLDFDADVGIPAGRNWEQELYAQLRRIDAVVFLAPRPKKRARRDAWIRVTRLARLNENGHV